MNLGAPLVLLGFGRKKVCPCCTAAVSPHLRAKTSLLRSSRLRPVLTKDCLYDSFQPPSWQMASAVRWTDSMARLCWTERLPVHRGAIYSSLGRHSAVQNWRIVASSSPSCLRRLRSHNFLLVFFTIFVVFSPKFNVLFIMTPRIRVDDFSVEWKRSCFCFFN